MTDGTWDAFEPGAGAASANGMVNGTSAHAAVPALDIRHISMSFGPVPVLSDVDIAVMPGEIHGLLGANGAGKSTLVKILAGYHHPSPGSEADLWGRPVQFPLKHPERFGLVIVHQDLGLVENMTVLENFGAVIRFGSVRYRPVSWRKLRRDVTRRLEEFGVGVGLDDLMSTVTPGVRASVAIMRALESAQRAGAERVLMLLDEPTVYLGPGQREILFDLIRRLTRQGNSAIFISHRLPEVIDLCDRVSVLRDGRRVSTHETASITAAELVHQMLGYSVDQFYPDPEANEDPSSVLRLQAVSCGQLRSLSLSITAGEIVGVTGVPGSGVDDLPHLLSGDQRAAGGVVEVFGEDMTKTLNPRSGRGRGIVVVPADRHRHAVWLEGTSAENLTLGSVSKFFSGGRFHYGSERRYAAGALRQYGVRPTDPDRFLRTFSGGNQQKIVLARALESRPKILVLHEATQGVDAGGKKDILDLISAAARSGVAVVMSSTDYEELAHVCHRVVVLHEGAVAVQLSAPAITEDALSRAVQLQ